jgi:DNA polymerase III delta prime subunit
MGPNQALRALTATWQLKRPLLLWGPPGVGKSSVVRQAAHELGVEFRDLRGSQLDPVDLRGVPFVKDGRAEWATPAFFPRGGEGILLLDEIDKAPSMVQAAFLQLVLDRSVGEYTLPEGWWVVAAANRVEDRAGSGRLISPLLNRFCHLDVEPSLPEWQQWALGAGIRPEVRAFLNFKTNLLFAFEPALNERAFPTPRSWEAVSDLYGLFPPEDLLHDLVSGAVGRGPAAEFLGFVQVWGSLPDIDQLLKNPQQHPIPHDLVSLHALGSAVVERLRPTNGAPVDVKVPRAVALLMTRLPQEIQASVFRDAVSLDRRIIDARTLGVPQVEPMLARLAPLLIQFRQKGVPVE